jgi:hypothetical protein
VHFDTLGSPLYARLAERVADEPAYAEWGYGQWDLPLRLFGGVRYLVLDGTAPDALSGEWDDFRAALDEHRPALERFVAEQGVQTNEAQRCYALLPAFLLLAGRPLELIELGPSAGLNLLWDRHAYAYEAGTWGGIDARLRLTGGERGRVPAELLARTVEVRRRRGIDREPVDATSEHGARLLRAFLWPGRPEREERLVQAIETLRAEPPELIRGDYVELLPELLADRGPDALTVVFETASRVYLSDEQRRAIRAAVDEAARDGGVAFIATRTESEDDEPGGEGYALELDGRVVARMDYHGSWVDWRA